MAFVWKMTEKRGSNQIDRDMYFGAVSDIYDYMRDNKKHYEVTEASYKHMEYKNEFGDKIFFDKKYMYKKEWM